MLESMAEWMSFPLYYAYDGAPPPTRNGAAHATIYPYGPFPTGDGKTVMLGLQNEREWAEFCKTVLLEPAIATDERFSSNARRTAAREDLHAIIVAGVLHADARSRSSRGSRPRRSPTPASTRWPTCGRIRS